MKYPLQITIITAAVFAYMAYIIMDGTITFGTPEKLTHFLRIQSVHVKCAIPEIQKNRPDMQGLADGMTSKLQALCNDLPACDIDTAALYGTRQHLNNCMDEIRLTYTCTPDPAPKQLFLYEGQHGTVSCDESTPVK